MLYARAILTVTLLATLAPAEQLPSQQVPVVPPTSCMLRVDRVRRGIPLQGPGWFDLSEPDGRRVARLRPLSYDVGSIIWSSDSARVYAFRFKTKARRSAWLEVFGYAIAIPSSLLVAAPDGRHEPYGWAGFGLGLTSLFVAARIGDSARRDLNNAIEWRATRVPRPADAAPSVCR
jgi:hypothetical protein